MLIAQLSHECHELQYNYNITTMDINNLDNHFTYHGQISSDCSCYLTSDFFLVMSPLTHISAFNMGGTLLLLLIENEESVEEAEE